MAATFASLLLVTLITNFTSDLIFRFAWSPDGKHLALARGNISSDILLFSKGQ